MKKLSITKILVLLLVMVSVVYLLNKCKAGYFEGVNDAQKHRTKE